MKMTCCFRLVLVFRVQALDMTNNVSNAVSHLSIDGPVWGFEIVRVESPPGLVSNVSGSSLY